MMNYGLALQKQIYSGYIVVGGYHQREQVPYTCKYAGATAVPPPGHYNAISSG